MTIAFFTINIFNILAIRLINKLLTEIIVVRSFVSIRGFVPVILVFLYGKPLSNFLTSLYSHKFLFLFGIFAEASKQLFNKCSQVSLINLLFKGYFLCAAENTVVQSSYYSDITACFSNKFNIIMNAIRFFQFYFSNQCFI